MESKHFFIDSFEVCVTDNFEGSLIQVMNNHTRSVSCLQVSCDTQEELKEAIDNLLDNIR